MKIFRQFRRVAETLDNPAKISGELTDRLDLGPGTEE
jgi:hypothetical protein